MLYLILFFEKKKVLVSIITSILSKVKKYAKNICLFIHVLIIYNCSLLNRSISGFIDEIKVY